MNSTASGKNKYELIKEVTIMLERLSLEHLIIVNEMLKHMCE